MEAEIEIVDITGAATLGVCEALSDDLIIFSFINNGYDGDSYGTLFI